MLNFICLSRTCTALRKCMSSNGIINISRYMPYFSTCSVLYDKDLSKVSYLKDGNDGEIGTDEQYPEWLWNLKGNKQTLDGLDWYGRTYSRILRKRQRRDENERRKMKRF